MVGLREQVEFTVNQPEKGKTYSKRVGAYGIIENDKRHLGIIRTSTGYFLVGGGVEDGEAVIESLKREFVEEAALIIDEIEAFASGSYFFHSSTMDCDMESYGHFFKCKVIDALDVAVDEDHELIWITADEAMKNLYLKNQQEAVRLYKQKYL